MPLPLTIAHYAQLVLAKWRAKGLLDLTGPAGYNALSTQINTLIAEFGATERLGTMAIPAICATQLVITALTRQTAFTSSSASALAGSLTSQGRVAVPAAGARTWL